MGTAPDASAAIIRNAADVVRKRLMKPARRQGGISDFSAGVHVPYNTRRNALLRVACKEGFYAVSKRINILIDAKNYKVHFSVWLRKVCRGPLGLNWTLKYLLSLRIGLKNNVVNI